MNKKTILSLLALVLGTMSADVQAQSAGDLMVAPTRVLFQDRDRTKEINLINVGSKEATYRISLKNMHMKEDGSYEDITEPKAGEKFADPYLRFSPRQVTLKPGEVQKIRIMTRLPAELPPGEYRSHLMFKGLPPETSGDDIEAVKVKDGQVAVKLIPIFGLTIPVIFRHGTVDAKASILAVNALPPQGDAKVPDLSVTLGRSGSASLYGDLSVNYVPEGTSGEGVVVSQLRGVSVLTPYVKRTVRMPLYFPDTVKFNGGKFRIIYRNSVDEGGQVLTQTEIAVQ